VGRSFSKYKYIKKKTFYAVKFTEIYLDIILYKNLKKNEFLKLKLIYRLTNF